MFLHNYQKTNRIPIVIIIIAVLVGYYELFYGHNLWLYKDQLLNSSWAYGNSLGNGWRPDKGFGISFFYSDPGSWHPWSFQVFWQKLVSSRSIAYSSVVVFTFGMDSVHYNKHNSVILITVPLLLILLHDYYKNITEDDVREAIDVDDIFSSYEFEVEENHCDLYFWGIKK